MTETLENRLYIHLHISCDTGVCQGLLTNSEPTLLESPANHLVQLPQIFLVQHKLLLHQTDHCPCNQRHSKLYHRWLDPSHSCFRLNHSGNLFNFAQQYSSWHVMIDDIICIKQGLDLCSTLLVYSKAHPPYFTCSSIEQQLQYTLNPIEVHTSQHVCCVKT